MAKKVLADQTIEALVKARQRNKSVMYVGIALMVIYIGFLIYLLINKSLAGQGAPLVVIPVMFAAAVVPAMSQIKAIDKELERRKEV